MAENTKIGVLVDLDFCVGCYACQSACNMHWDLPVGDSYIKVFRTPSEVIDGELRMYMLPIPFAMDRCAECVASEEGTPCTKICIGKALTIGPAEDVREMAENLNRPTALFE